MKNCPRCGSGNSDAAQFCAGCGLSFSPESTTYQNPQATQPFMPQANMGQAQMTHPNMGHAQMAHPNMGHMPVAKTTNAYAIASLVLGLVGFSVCGIGSILGIVFGMMARKQIDASGGMQEGRGMAIAGIILSCISLVAVVVYLVLMVGIMSLDSSGV